MASAGKALKPQINFVNLLLRTCTSLIGDKNRNSDIIEILCFIMMWEVIEYGQHLCRLLWTHTMCIILAFIYFRILLFLFIKVNVAICKFVTNKSARVYIPEIFWKLNGFIVPKIFLSCWNLQKFQTWRFWNLTQICKLKRIFFLTYISLSNQS